jgi:predicted O-methyltransferase YrrM
MTATRMNAGFTLVERLMEDKPKLHQLSEEEAKDIGARTGVPLEAGLVSWAVPRQVLEYFGRVISPKDRTAETGGGYSTVALAALAGHHDCFTKDVRSAELTHAYLTSLGIADKATIIVGGSEVSLGRLSDEQRYDFAFVDGCHAYPLPAIDWHFLDLHLKIGGVMGFDNVEIPAVHTHCEFLRGNGTYREVDRLTFPKGNYTVCFFEKLKDEPRWDLAQRFCRRRVSRNGVRDTAKTIWYGLMGREGNPWPWS